MSVLELTNQQVLSLVRQLPAKRKRVALLALAQEAQASRAERMSLGETRLRRAVTKHGLKWERLSEGEREEFVNRLLHEA